MSANIDKIALRALSVAFDEFVGACTDEHGKPRAPKPGALAKARGYLPPYCKHSYTMERQTFERLAHPEPGHSAGCIVFPTRYRDSDHRDQVEICCHLCGEWFESSWGNLERGSEVDCERCKGKFTIMYAEPA